MGQSFSPRSLTDRWHFRVRFLPVLIVLSGGLLLLWLWGKPLSEEVRVRVAVLQAKDCVLKDGGVGCYVERLSGLMQSRDKELAAKVCSRLEDPVCYQAFGRLASKVGDCSKLLIYGGQAVVACTRGYYQRAQ